MWKRYADEIADAIERLVEGVAVWANIAAMIMVFIFLLITCPVWSIPYIVWRNKKEETQDEQR